MEKYSNKYQIVKLILIIALLIITPLLSSSLRSKYLYFIVNILIISVCAEAGLLSFFLQSPEYENHDTITSEETITSNHSVRDVKMSFNEVKVNKKKVIRKSPSTPSIFFIGESADESEDQASLEQDDEELFVKAEMFIGNFYEQLKMQREESWKKLLSA